MSNPLHVHTQVYIWHRATGALLRTLQVPRPYLPMRPLRRVRYWRGVLCYAPPTPCPVLAWRVVLCAPYAVSGTDI
eukprot:3667750-Rhodomonas_salina.2